MEALSACTQGRDPRPARRPARRQPPPAPPLARAPGLPEQVQEVQEAPGVRLCRGRPWVALGAVAAQSPRWAASACAGGGHRHPDSRRCHCRRQRMPHPEADTETPGPASSHRRRRRQRHRHRSPAGSPEVAAAQLAVQKLHRGVEDRAQAEAEAGSTRAWRRWREGNRGVGGAASAQQRQGGPRCRARGWCH